MNEKLKELFRQYAGCEAESVTRLTAAGSNRVYYRFAFNGKTVVGVEGTNADENAAFLSIGQDLASKGLPVPQILAVADDRMCYLLQDLGDVSLFDTLKSARESGEYSAEQTQLLEKVIRLLPQLQFKGGQGMDFTVCFPCESFDRRSIFWDLNYFKYNFLKAVGPEFHEARLEDDFERFAALLLKDAPYDTFMYRDFQARNVMIKDGEPWFIDFQGGRRGPIEYDLASFLWQARAAYPDNLKQHLIDVYLEALAPFLRVSEKDFRASLHNIVLFRTLQVLGAYGFRGYFEQKKHFIESIPPAIQNLRELLASSSTFHYPYLMDVLRRITELPQYQQIKTVASRADGYKTTDKNPYNTHPQDGPATFSKYDAQGPLVVKVFSFSYTKGIPEDESGNGGGYVFDCRSTHNPGRYEPYKQLTGLDEPVIRFLEDDGEILTFLDSVYKLAENHVRRYIQRGFTSLMFCFGCTGGQHRSVYSAQHLAEHIHEKFGVEVRICHREQGITQILKPNNN